MNESGIPLTPDVAGTADLPRDMSGQQQGPAPKFIGRFPIECEIARGGMGIVFKARDPASSEPVAVKVLKEGAWASPEKVKRLEREAAAARKLEHPGIIGILEVGSDNQSPFIVMPFLRGISLDHAIAGHGISARDAARIVKETAEALQYAHERGVVHRDIKPSNIMLEQPTWAGQSCDYKRAVILDLGLAKDSADSTRLTRTGAVMGSPAYMSPEQVRGIPERIGAATDIYSLGAVLYELLTGRPPFDSSHIPDTFQRILEDDPIPPSRLNPFLHRDLETICLKATEKTPAERYAGAREFADDLRRFLTGEPILAKPYGVPARLKRFARRQKVGLALAAVFLLGLGTWELGTRIVRAQEFRGHIKLALDAAARGDVEIASQELSAAAAIDADAESLRQAKALYYLESAVVAAERKEFDRATGLFTVARELGADRLKPDRYRAVRQLVEGTAEVSVETVPPGADVQLFEWDERDFAMESTRAPYAKQSQSLKGDDSMLDVPFGLHRMTVRKEGFAPLNVPVLLNRSERRKERIVLLPESAVPPDMVYVPEGDFITGDAIVGTSAARVKGFLIDRFEVTNKRYQEFIDATEHRPPPCWRSKKFPRDEENHPVREVSWEDAAAFAKWSGVRLPTEAEWEKAARGVDGRLYPWGNAFEKEKLNCEDGGLAYTTPVGSFPAGRSPYGCYDMAGNLWEWTASASKNDAEFMAVKGGSWANAGADNRASLTNCAEKTHRSNSIGFRCARDIQD